MPLTIAHPVAVLPFKRIGLPLAALVAGSMSPDLEHFLYMAPQSYVSHTLPGLFLFCLPAGTLLLWLYTRLWLPAAATLIPLPQPHTPTPRETAAWPALAILIGAATHIVWDAFTHEYGFAVLRLPALSATLGEGTWHALPVFKLLQHGTGLLGLGILGVIALHHRAKWPVIRPRLLLILLLALAAAGLVAILSVWLQFGFPAAIREVGRYAGTAIVRFAVISLIGFTAFSLAVRGRKRLEG